MRKISEYTIIVLLLLAQAGCAGQISLLPESPVAEPPGLAFEQEIDQLRRDLKIPGMSVAVVRGQEVVLARGFGYADMENEIAATENTPYEIASLTKPFAAAILLQLVEEGQLDLDADMAELLADTTFTFPPPADAPVPGYETLCQVLIELSQATSGPFEPLAVLFQDYHCDTGRIAVKHHLTHTAQGVPGDAYRYNGFLYGLLAWVAQESAGQPFDQLLIERIVDPLEMKDTYPNPDTTRSRQILASIAEPCRVNEAGDIVPSDYQTDGWVNAGAGMVSTVMDLARFDVAMDRDQLVSARSKEAMFSPTLSNDGQPLPYGMGWFVQEYQGTKLLWHYGWEPEAYSSLMLKIPDYEVTFILLANSDGASAPFNLGAGDVLQSPFATTFIDYFTDLKGPEL